MIFLTFSPIRVSIRDVLSPFPYLSGDDDGAVQCAASTARNHKRLGSWASVLRFGGGFIGGTIELVVYAELGSHGAVGNHAGHCVPAGITTDLQACVAVAATFDLTQVS